MNGIMIQRTALGVGKHFRISVLYWLGADLGYTLDTTKSQNIYVYTKLLVGSETFRAEMIRARAAEKQPPVRRIRWNLL